MCFKFKWLNVDVFSVYAGLVEFREMHHETCLSQLSVFVFSEPCAIMPPLELFMEVPFEERRATLYRDLEKGDIVLGRINNIREYGFFLTLLCTAVGLKRDIEDLELSVGQQDKSIHCS